MRTADAHVFGRWTPDAPFELRLRSQVPHDATASAVHLLKPFVDGVISAFHDYVGPDLDRMSVRLAEALGAEQPRIRSLLAGSGLAVLGPRRVIAGWGEATQWNPADDLCASGSLVIHRSTSPHWLLSGEIAEIRVARPENRTPMSLRSPPLREQTVALFHVHETVVSWFSCVGRPNPSPRSPTWLWPVPYFELQVEG